LYYNDTIENTDYQVLEDFEPTDLNDIMFVEKLSEKDFDSKILREGGENQEKINLDEDIELDGDMDLAQAYDFGVGKKNVIPKRSLFR
jgi:hypothetical protein